CHKHPFDQWSKQDFDDFTKLFTAIRYGTPNEDAKTFREMSESLGLKGNGGAQRRAIVELLKDGKAVPWEEVFVSYTAPSRNNRRRANRNNRPAPTQVGKLLGGTPIELRDGVDPREALME